MFLIDIRHWCKVLSIIGLCDESFRDIKESKDFAGREMRVIRDKRKLEFGYTETKGMRLWVLRDKGK
jgi:hypothetical protein